MTTTRRRLRCAETWAGNSNAAGLIELPGLHAWVHSEAFGPGHGGGDVHYVSVCPDCLVCRIALADVSGHGVAVEAVGEKLEQLMQQYLRTVEQVALMRDLNQAVREELGEVHYATMVAVGWHARKGQLVLTNAGHPPPLWHRALDDEWIWVDTPPAYEPGRVAGVPLGLLPDVTYDRRVIRLQLHDLLVLYTDGVSESVNSAGEELGHDGLMQIIRELKSRSADTFGTDLTSALNRYRDGVPAADDETIIVLQRVIP
jgi:sigma-B regulation protein RsbU (phosphoserine phosphatase)